MFFIAGGFSLSDVPGIQPPFILWFHHDLEDNCVYLHKARKEK